MKPPKKILLVLGMSALFFLLWFTAYRLLAENQQPAHSEERGEKIQEQPTSIISGMVVPHHDIVRQRRTEFFTEIHKKFFAEENPKTVILISPNHFEQGRANIQTTNRVWHTDRGDISPAQSVINILVQNGIAIQEPESFIREHGITLILGNIRQTFPGATLVPIIVKRETTPAEIELLATTLNTVCASCLVIASVDFSHYQPAALANLHDQLSLRALQNRDRTLLFKHAEVDSPAALAFLAQWATLRNTYQFNTFDHTNSGVITGQPDTETTTHIFGWYQEGTATAPNKSVTFAVAGDMMFGRAIGHSYEKKGFTHLFDTIGNRVLWGVDAAFANLEGPTTAQKVAYDPKLMSLSFLFPKTSIDALSFLHLDGVSLANNHTLNNGSAGLRETRDLLQKSGISPIGDPSHVTDTSVTFFTGEGLRLAVVGVHALVDSSGTAPLIRKLKKDPGNRILIFPHWGTEYALTHSKTQEALAKQWIDAGADLIIGAHPHVIQDIGVYKGAPIVYSLGNFIFDQSFSQETQQGLIVTGSFTGDGLSLYLFPHRSTRYQPTLLRGEEKQTIIDRITKNIKPYLKQSDAGSFLFFPNR